MKDNSTPAQPAELIEKPQHANLFADYLALTKHRLLFLVLFSTSLGYFLGAQENSNHFILLYILIGVSLVGGGANTLNQWYETDVDTQMERTKNRPLPSGRVHRNSALWFGVGISVLGFIFLSFTINLLTQVLCFISWASYLFLYTPLKKITPLNTWVGTVPGALPAVLGWTAITGSLNWGIAFLFAILYFWQLAHFFAISWIYRSDYVDGGFKMLSWNDPDGSITAKQILINTVLLLLASINLFLSSDQGLIYLYSSIAIALVFIYYAIIFFREKSPANARKVFFYSILYLPLLFVALILDRLL